MARELLLGGLLVLVGAAAQGQDVTMPKRLYGLGSLGPAAVSPDKQHLATAGESAAYLWDVETGTVRNRLEGHGTPVSILAFSPDGKRLFTGTRFGAIGIWSLDSEPLGVFLAAHKAEINSITFSPDGQRFASASIDNTAAVWSVEDGALLSRVTVSGSSINAAVFTPDGLKLVTADNSLTNSVRLWDLETGTAIRVFGEHQGAVLAVAILPNGLLATGGEDQKVRLWNVETGQLTATLQGAHGGVRFLLPVPNTTTLIGGCSDNRVVIWDTSTGNAVQSWPTEPLNSLTLVPDSEHVLMSSPDLLVRFVDYKTGLTQRAVYGHTTSTTLAVAFSPDGQYVVSGGVEKATRLWSRTNANLVRVFEGHSAGSYATAFSPDGRQLLTTTGLPRKVAQLWNTETGELEREFVGHTDWLLAAAFSPDGSRIATGAQDHTLRVWDAATGQQLHSFSSGGAFTHCVAFSPDGKLVAGGGSSFDSTVRIWNVENGQGVGMIGGEAGTIKAVAFSNSGDELFVGWEDGLVRVFHLGTGQVVQELYSSGFLSDVALSPDGDLLLMAEGWPSFAARLVEWRSGRLLRVFGGHTAPVESVAFNARGTQILTGADVVRLWDITDVAARLRMDRKPGGFELRWNLGVLQEATSFDGVWTPVASAVSPWTVPNDAPAKFYRVSAASGD